jgi:hypothetical protein
VIGSLWPGGAEELINRPLCTRIWTVMSSIQASAGNSSQLAQIVTMQQINISLMRKSLDVQKQTGDAINSLLEQAVEIQRQLANGHLDIKA